MEQHVVRVCAHHALTPMADGSDANYSHASQGQSAVTHHDATSWCVADDFMAGLITDATANADASGSTRPANISEPPLPRVAAMALHSIRQAMAAAARELPPDKTLLVLSTTKGDIQALTTESTAKSTPDSVRLGHLAQTLASALGLTMPPLTVSNACTSGVCAIIAAARALVCRQCEVAIVCGVEEQSRFIVSGFQSFHALSPDMCRPFSKNRNGLNVGEAAATIILDAVAANAITPSDWTVAAGAIRNDANHISGPSRTGEGSFRAIEATMHAAEAGDLAFVSVHGTATPYNDEMESIALERAGLSQVPAGSLKGYYGHTMGAAGVLETILSIEAVEHSTILATLGYDEELGVSRPVDVSTHNRPTCRQSFLKLISGFGGCNAAVRLTRGGHEAFRSKATTADDTNAVTACNASAAISACGFPATQCPTIRITPEGAWLNGSPLPSTLRGTDLITECYHIASIGYPKFYKMDSLCRLGFVASELLLQSLGEERFVPRDDRAIVLLSRSGCLDTDRHYSATIQPGDNYFPSPSVFVYTLPNIVTGEIAIRNKYHGETSMYLSEADTPELRRQELRRIARLSLTDTATTTLLTGWVDYEDAEHFEAYLAIVSADTIDSI